MYSWTFWNSDMFCNLECPPDTWDGGSNHVPVNRSSIGKVARRVSRSQSDWMSTRLWEVFDVWERDMISSAEAETWASMIEWSLSSGQAGHFCCVEASEVLAYSVSASPLVAELHRPTLTIAIDSGCLDWRTIAVLSSVLVLKLWSMWLGWEPCKSCLPFLGICAIDRHVSWKESCSMAISLDLRSTASALICSLSILSTSFSQSLSWFLAFNSTFSRRSCLLASTKRIGCLLSSDISYLQPSGFRYCAQAAQGRSLSHWTRSACPEYCFVKWSYLDLPCSTSKARQLCSFCLFSDQIRLCVRHDGPLLGDLTIQDVLQIKHKKNRG